MYIFASILFDGLQFGILNGQKGLLGLEESSEKNQGREFLFPPGKV